MKAFILKIIADKISKGKFIKKALRVDSNLILFRIDKTDYFFDLTKGDSDIYININYEITKKFNAPFDIILAKKFTNSKLVEVKVVERILTLKVETNLGFKKEENFIIFEFTGRHTNAIIVDKNFIILEALRHLTENFRKIQPGVKLCPLPPIEIKEKEFEIDDIEKYTQKLFQDKQKKRLDGLKKNIINSTNKKIKKLKTILENLPSEKELLKESEKYKIFADLALINLHKIKRYDKVLEVNFNGKEVKIPIPHLKNLNEIGNYYYNLSKKMKKKAKNIQIERKNLTEKIEFLENYKKGVEKSNSIDELNIFKTLKKKRDKHKNDNIEKFFIDDFIVLIGKNEKGNIQLLKESRANDLWFHVKNRPGAHAIIKTNKKKIPEKVIEKVAKLALLFSNEKEGIVDYTKRGNLYIKKGAFVNYITYKSVKVKI